jgi:hypothetical protein
MSRLSYPYSGRVVAILSTTMKRMLQLKNAISPSKMKLARRADSSSRLPAGMVRITDY